MSRLKKHAITVALIAIAVAIALMFWSRKTAAEVGRFEGVSGTALAPLTQVEASSPPMHASKP
ncbi:MAG TPA: hypothetical protein VFB54_09460 [Burkholderiales bacterium]|nr:hypothetical protein [Burkholderiales bacterium]